MVKKAMLGSVLILGACTTFIEKSIQEVEFVTPGAQGAVCNIYVEKLRYKIHPPITVTIHKSKKEMVVDCRAPGNRRQKLFIEPEIDPTSTWNLANAGAGYVYDYMSKSLFKYPERVIVDFTGAAVTAMPQPAQNNPDIKQPEEYELEEFGPSKPKMNMDKYYKESPILRRGESLYGDDVSSEVFFDPPKAAVSGKSKLMIEQAGSESSAADKRYLPAPTNFTEPKPDPSFAAPVPLVPGE